MRLSCILIVLFGSLLSFGQFINKVIDYNGESQYPISVVEEDSGYTIMGNGINRSLNGGWWGSVVIKTDSNGDVVTENFYGKRGYTHFIGFQGSFKKSKKGGYVVGLTRYDTISNNYDALLIRYNDKGDTTFVREYGGNSDEKGMQVVETPDGGYAIAGESSTVGGEKFYLIKTDSSGNLEWQKIYPQPNEARALTIVNAHDGGYLLSGWGQTPGRDYDTYVMKVDSLGNKQWTKIYGTRKHDCGGIITLSSDDSYILTTCFDTLGLTQPDGTPIITRSIFKLDIHGNPIWRYYYFTEKVSILNMSREVAPGKGYIAVGSIYDTIGGYNNEYGLILRFDNDGNLLWERRYAYYSHFFDRFLFSRLFDVQPTADRGFICLGRSFETNQVDFWLLKIDSNGCMGEYCGFSLVDATDTTDTTDTLGNSVLSNQQSGIRVYPNPVKDCFYMLGLKFNGVEAYNLRLYDILGKNVLSSELMSEKQKVSVEELNNGIYFYEVLSEQKPLRQGKIVIR